MDVPNPNKTFSRVGMHRSDTVPKAFVVVAGQKTQKKLELCNAMLCDWQLDLQMAKKPSKGKICPYYAPATQNKDLRVFYSHMRKNHSWLFTEHDFKNWKGCLDGLLTERYAQRLGEYVSERTSCFLFYFMFYFTDSICFQY